MPCMSTMSMNKVIHGAIRRDLERFLGALTTLRPGDTERARRLGRAWANFDDELTHHHEGEHEIAWPALEQLGVSRETISQMDAEHEVMAAALAETRSAMKSLETSPGQGETQTALAAMQHLRDVTVAHLDHEEQEIEPVYLENVDSAPVKEMGKKFARAQNPARAGRFFAWVTDGATAQEREAVADGIPKPVLAILSGVFGRGYRKEIAPTWTT
jgi:hemerythrin-like domain-containing protein